MTDFIEDWLENKLLSGDCGILIDEGELNSFHAIQNFLENNDSKFKTPVIYYEAFPNESPWQFLDTLREELVAKLGNLELDKLNSENSFLKIIEDAGLKMIIIDNCYLHPQNTLEQLLKIFTDCHVAVILVGEGKKIETTQILDIPTVSNWDKFTYNLVAVS